MITLSTIAQQPGIIIEDGLQAIQKALTNQQITTAINLRCNHQSRALEFHQKSTVCFENKH